MKFLKENRKFKIIDKNLAGTVPLEAERKGTPVTNSLSGTLNCKYLGKVYTST